MSRAYVSCKQPSPEATFQVSATQPIFARSFNPHLTCMLRHRTPALIAALIALSSHAAVAQQAAASQTPATVIRAARLVDPKSGIVTTNAVVVVVSAVSGHRRTGGHLRRAVFCAQFCWLLLHVAPLRAEVLAAPQYTSPA
jgi:hypothetical protein